MDECFRVYSGVGQMASVLLISQLKTTLYEAYCIQAELLAFYRAFAWVGSSIVLWIFCVVRRI